MSDYDLPDLPSDDDLGITDEDREFLKEIKDDGPEMSDEEMRALLGDVPAAASPEAAKPAKPDRKAARAAKKAAKEALKEEKRKAKEAKQRAREADKKSEAGAADGPEATADRPPTDAERAERVARSIAASAQSGAGPKKADGKSEKEAEAKRGTEPAAAPVAPDGPRSRWRGPATLVALLVLSVVASSRTGLPRPVPANAPDTTFSSARAMSTLIEIASEAHPPGSPEHARVRAFLVDRLSSLGLEPEVQTTTSLVQRGPVALAATVRNVVARIPGTDPTGSILMTAHYDGRGISVAASDDGVGVVTIIEAIRAVMAGGPLRNDLIVLITDGEELGLLGARAFVEEHPMMSDVSLVLSFEMRGSAGPAIMFETKDQNGWVVRAFDAFDPYPFANSFAFEVYERMPNDSDFTPFKEAGKQGLNFAAIDNAHVYHQEYDTPQALSEATLQHHGIHALAAARYFGDADLTSVDAPNVVYFSVPLLGLIVYEQMWVWALSGALVLLLVGTFLLARRSGARPSRIGIGLGVSLVAMAAAFGATYVLVGWLPRFHPEAGSLQGSRYHREGWYMIALAGIAFTAVTGLYGVARRWLTAAELGVGAVVLPLVAAVVLGVFAPLAAMNLQWPVLAALVSLAALVALGPRFGAAVGWVTAVLLTIPVLFLLVPVTELLWLALTFDLAVGLSVLIVTALLLCLPALEALRHPNSWWAPLTGVAVAGGAIGLGIVTSGANAERPSPSTLVYAYEHGTGAAVWATDASADSLDGEASRWAVQRAGGPFEGRRDLAGFAYVGGQSPTAPARVVSATPPEVILRRDTIDGPTRRVTLTVRSRIGAEFLGFVYDQQGDTRLLSINGRPISDPQDILRVDHWGEPDPAVTLELEMPADQPIGLHIVEHLLRPEELLGPDAFDRPPHLAPDINRLSDRAMFRYSVAAFADPRHTTLLPGVARTDTLPAATTTPVGDTLSVEPDTLGADTIAPGSVPDTGSAAAVEIPPDTGRVTTPAVPPDTGSAGAAASPPDTGSVTVPTVLPDTIGEGTEPRRTPPNGPTAVPPKSR